MASDVLFDLPYEIDATLDGELSIESDALGEENAAAGTLDFGPASVWGYDATPDARHMETGGNVSWVHAAGERDPIPFINRIKTATGWTTSGDAEQIAFDDNGYVTVVPERSYVSSNILRHSPDLDGLGPFFGEYRIYGVGDGVIAVTHTGRGALVAYERTSDLPTEVIDGVSYWYADFDYTSEIDSRGRLPMVNLNIYDTDADDHIRDLALVHHDHLDAHRAGEVFTPEFVSDLEGYETLRFMDWGLTNYITEEYRNGPFSDPEARYLEPEAYTYATRGGFFGNISYAISSIPIEHLVDLANEVGADPWINLAVDITDARAMEIAAHVEGALDDGLQVYWEYGNELWNSAPGFDSNKYAWQKAIEVFGYDANPSLRLAAAAEWAAYRGPQLYDMIDTLFTDNPEIESRYVAGTWAAQAPIDTDGTFRTGSFSYIYFDALEAQKMPDAPSRPEDIVTDYAIGLYFGEMGHTDVARWIVESYDTPSEQAAAVARWMLFANREEAFHELGSEVLDRPVQNVSWRDDLNISVYKLVRDDIRDGLDPLRDLDEVLRLNGDMLQYKGARAADWTTILTFADAPPKTLDEMLHDTNLMGYGTYKLGQEKSGLGSGIARTTENRLEGHSDFVEALGLDFVAYEGGMSLPKAGSLGEGIVELYQALIKDGWTATLTNALFDNAEKHGMDLFNRFTTHDMWAMRDNWGTKAYTGQPESSAPLAAMLKAEAELPAPETAPYVGDTLEDWRTDRLLAALSINPGPGWQDLGDGVYQTGEAHERLKVTMGVETGELYRLSFDVAVTSSDPGKLSISGNGFGNGNTQVMAVREEVVDGSRLSFEFTVPEPHDNVGFVISRVEGNEGLLSLSDISLELVAPAEETEVPEIENLAPAFAPEAWKTNDDWTLDPLAGTATGVLGNGRLTTTLPVSSGAQYVLSFDLETELAEAGLLRVHAKAFGSGSTHVGNWSDVAIDGRRVEITLDAIPEPHDRLALIFQRSAGMAGELTISNLTLQQAETEADMPESVAPMAPAAGPEAAGEIEISAPAPETETPLSLGPSIAPAFAPEAWKTGDDWTLDPLAGTATGGLGNGWLTTTLPVSGGAQYVLSFDLETELAEAGLLRVHAKAFGSGSTQVGSWSDVAIDGRRVEITLDAIPEPHDRLALIFQRSAGMAGELTISNLTLQQAETFVVRTDPLAEADRFAFY